MTPLKERLIAEAIANMAPLPPLPNPDPVLNLHQQAVKTWRREIDRERAYMRCYHVGPANTARTLAFMQSMRRHIAAIKAQARREGVQA